MEKERAESSPAASSSGEIFDLVVMGAGPGGYVAAIRAAQFGLRVAVCEAGHPGGTCLNWGCIPTKCYAASARVFEEAKAASAHGIDLEIRGFDFARVHARKEGIVENLRNGIEQLFKKRKINLLKGFARFVGPDAVEVAPTGPDGQRLDGAPPLAIRARRFIIATGTRPLAPAALATDGRFLIDSTGLLDLAALPSSLAIVGGGVIGCEFASALSTFGVRVTIVEALPRLLPREDKQVSNTLRLALKKAGVDIRLNGMVTGVERGVPAPGGGEAGSRPAANDTGPASTGGGGALTGAETSGVLLTLGDGSTVWAEKVLVAIGRTPYTGELGLLTAGVTTLGSGYIPVNSGMETSESHIYAVGDVTGEHFLAHTASHGGLVAAANAAASLGFAGATVQKADFTTVPNCIFTEPEIASIGATEEQLKESGVEYAVGRFPMAASGKAQASGHAEGFVKILSARSDGAILGCHILGPGASDLIAEVALARRNGLTVNDIAHTIHAHPTLAESVAEAAEAALGMPIHTFAASALLLAASMLVSLLLPGGFAQVMAQQSSSAGPAFAVSTQNAVPTQNSVPAQSVAPTQNAVPAQSVAPAQNMVPTQNAALARNPAHARGNAPVSASLVSSLRPARGKRDSLDWVIVESAYSDAEFSKLVEGRARSLFIYGAVKRQKKYSFLLRGVVKNEAFEADEDLDDFKRAIETLDRVLMVPVVQGVSIELTSTIVIPDPAVDRLAMNFLIKGPIADFTVELDYLFNRRLGAVAPSGPTVENAAALALAIENDPDVRALADRGLFLASENTPSDNSVAGGEPIADGGAGINGRPRPVLEIKRSLSSPTPYIFVDLGRGSIARLVVGEPQVGLTAAGKPEEMTFLAPVPALLANSEFRGLCETAITSGGAIVVLARSGGIWTAKVYGKRGVSFEVDGERVRVIRDGEAAGR